MVEKKESTNRPDGNRSAARREALWQRLEALLEKARRRGFSALTEEEIDAFGKLYRAAATHLSLLQAFGASAGARRRLNALVTRAHQVLYGRSQRGMSLRLILWSFLAFPETVRRTGVYHLTALGILLLGGLYGYVGAARDPEWVLELVPPGDERTPYAAREELYETLLYGRPRPETDAPVNIHAEPDEMAAEEEVEGGEKALFAAFLWRHNTTVALLAFFSGVAFGLPTLYLLFLNGTVLGVYSQMFHRHGLAYEWWAWILPHGVTELLAIVLLSGGGLAIGRLLLAPGDRSRLDALREARPHILRLILFAFPMLLLAALIESFVRQSGLSDGGRYTFAVASACFWAAYLALARFPQWSIERSEERSTLAERAVPLPSEEDLFGALRT